MRKSSKKKRRKKKRKQKKSLVGNMIGSVVEQTALATASTVGIVVIGSLPATPQATAMARARAFTGQSFAVMQNVAGAKGMLGSLESLTQFDTSKKKRKKGK